MTFNQLQSFDVTEEHEVRFVRSYNQGLRELQSLLEWPDFNGVQHRFAAMLADIYILGFCNSMGRLQRVTGVMTKFPYFGVSEKTFVSSATGDSTLVDQHKPLQL